MEAASQPEQVNAEGMAAFNGRADEEGPVTMLNLLRFKPDGGRERYAEYGEAVAPLLEGVGGRIVFVAPAEAPLLGHEGWDLVALVEYPNRRAFLEMVGSPAYQAIVHLRSEALSAGELHPMDAGAGA